MPKCAWILTVALTLILNQTIGIAATLNFVISAVFWIATTPAALIAVASLAAWHLTSCHAPRTRTRRRPVHAHH